MKTKTNKKEVGTSRSDEKRRWKDLPGNRYSPAELKRLAELDVAMERPPARPAIEV